ncbi:ribosomal protein S18-alanine N-acetyltransferase [Hutsoniella sourekii]|uniref:ribosomal protein S18-alanine N-acetyltransferase n=1 Tax=Hutsoniella sourekii TaxID=87650 RepID=UPI0004B6F79C|nr:ribosomal protein S18-alanine N-acetyltransferase [Hutsoniella sourekii]
MIILQVKYRPAIQLSDSEQETILSWQALNWSKKVQVADFENANAHYLLLTHSTQMIGFVSYHNLFGDWSVNQVFLLPAFRGQSLSYYLLEALIERFNEEAGEQIYLEVRESNMPAVRLYERSGFRVISRRPNYYKEPLEDALVMIYKRGVQ